MRTGFPLADAQDDFLRARRRARWARLAGWLRGHPSGCDRLLVLAETAVVSAASARGVASRGPVIQRAGGRGTVTQSLVPIERIVGTVEPTLSFDRHFRPTSQLPRTRFERIAAEVRSGRGMEPVDLYQCGDDYYVLDGHHRIAVARALGERSVWATITQVRESQLSCC
jgi:hypothetical protein